MYTVYPPHHSVPFQNHLCLDVKNSLLYWKWNAELNWVNEHTIAWVNCLFVPFEFENYLSYNVCELRLHSWPILQVNRSIYYCRIFQRNYNSMESGILSTPSSLLSLTLVHIDDTKANIFFSSKTHDVHDPAQGAIDNKVWSAILTTSAAYESKTIQHSGWSLNKLT